jgi:hypothetical protein
VPDHDHPYKHLFRQPELVADLLRLVLADLAAECDLTTLDRRNGSCVTDDWREREDDLIWRVRWRDRDLYVYLLLEFQSQVDRDMPVRIMTYLGLLYQDLRRSGAIAADAPLPAVVPLVLYNGDDPWTAPRDIRAAIGPVPAVVEPFLPHLPYLLLDEVRMALKPAAEERNLAAAVFRLEQTSDLRQQVRVAAAVKAWLAALNRPELLASFTAWWQRTLAQRHELPTDLNPFQDSPMLADRIHRFLDTVKAEGKAEGQVQAILDLVRDGDLSAAKALVRIQHLHDQRTISDETWDQARRTLGG